MTTGQGAVGSLEAAIDYAIDVVGIEALKPLQREAIRTFCAREGCVSPDSASLYVTLLVFDRLRGRKGSIALYFPRR